MNKLLRGQFLISILVLGYSVLGISTAAGQAPSIVQQPADQTVTARQSATFTVAVSHGPCRSLWLINGAGHYGAVASTISYTIANTTSAMNGWKVYVHLYGCGPQAVNLGNSRVATLIVNSGNGAPSISTEPANQTANVGQSATFSVTASGSAPLKYQWSKNGTTISGATSASYVTPATTSADNGSHFVVTVSNNAGTVTSTTATLTVSSGGGGPTITSQPSSQIVNPGQTATFTVGANGSAPLGYQWRQNGSNISGANTASYTTPATSSDNGKTFDVVVSNSVGSTTSKPATLTVNNGSSIATVSVNAGNPSIAIPSDFGSWSTFNIANNCRMMGTAAAPNPIFRQLIKNLVFPGQTFTITAEDDDGPLNSATPGGPSATDVSCAAQLWTDLHHAGISFNYWNGVPLCAGNQTLANQYASAFLNGMPSGWQPTMVVGNEPDGKCGIGYATYASRFATWTAGIRNLPGGANTLFMGPQLQSTGSPNVNSFINAEASRLAAAGEHGYPMAGGSCSGGVAGRGTIAAELGNAAASGFNSQLASQIADAHSKRTKLRMSETNSAFCGGVSGVSDVFASALWVMDYQFNLANAGVDGVNIFTDEGDAYDLFGFSSAPYRIQFLRPEYYGMVVFQQATQNGAKLVPVTVSTSNNIKAWATIDIGGTVRVLIINKDENAAGDVSVSLSGFGNATVSELLASSASATTGVTWAGQTLDGSPDGSFQGTPSTTTVTPSNGIYTFSLQRASAALLTIAP